MYRGNQVTAYQNLVAYWTFEEGEGTSTADVSGNGNDAKFFGNPAFTNTSNGKFGRAIDFDHNGDYLRVSHFAGITTSNYVSASAWVKLDTLGQAELTTQPLLAPMQMTLMPFCFGTMRMVPEPTRLFLQCWIYCNRNEPASSGASGAVANTWRHVVGTYNMGTKKIYVNGVLKGTVSNSTTQISPVGQDFYIGAAEGVTPICA